MNALLTRRSVKTQTILVSSHFYTLWSLGLPLSCLVFSVGSWKILEDIAVNVLEYILRKTPLSDKNCFCLKKGLFFKL